MNETVPIKWTEREIQDAVYIHCALKNHEIIVPNSCVFAWEADLVSVTKAGFISEFEIKISRGDFKADAKKERASLLLDPIKRTQGLSRVWEARCERPNYFYYAVPDGLITADEMPPFAGLLYIIEGPYGVTTREIRPAARIHKDKITDWQRRQLERALTERFWRQRLKNNPSG